MLNQYKNFIEDHITNTEMSMTKKIVCLLLSFVGIVVLLFGVECGVAALLMVLWNNVFITIFTMLSEISFFKALLLDFFIQLVGSLFHVSLKSALND